MRNIIVETKNLTTNYSNQRVHKKFPLGFLALKNQSDEQVEILIESYGELVLEGEKNNPLLFSLEKFSQGQANVSIKVLSNQMVTVYVDSFLSLDNQKKAKEMARKIRKGLKKEITKSIRGKIAYWLFGLFYTEVGVFKGCISIKIKNETIEEIPIQIGFCS